jgi:hypothetical protein
MTTTATATANRRRAGRVRVSDRCACAPDGQLCLWHYDQLDPSRRAGARRQAGVHEPYLGPRR